MAKPKRVMIQMRHTQHVAAAAFDAAPVAPAFTLTGIPGVTLDEEYQPVTLPAKSRRETIEPREVGVVFALDFTPEASSYLLRAEVDETSLDDLMEKAQESDDVVGVFADVAVQPIVACPTGPVGTDRDVEELLDVKKLHERGFDGTGVKVVIVDTGVNMPYLNNRGKRPNFDRNLSWKPSGAKPKGKMPVAHGTMCAYDVCIAAPNCTIIDHALLTSKTRGQTVMDGFLSDAVKSYALMLDWMTSPVDHPFMGQTAPSLVVNNSWGMFHPSWDFPPGHPANYSDNPLHPFTIVVESLEAAGADILFAAGNCGREGPDRRCKGVTNGGIYGANSSDAVLSVAGVIISKERICYSSQGPGRLSERKPDVACYTHFAGSGVYAADGGTSAATPVATGVVAAIRRVYPPSVISPSVLRNLIRRTAEDRGKMGFDYDYGFGVLDAKALLAALDRLTH
jgi:subtilisin family serine protease